MLSLGDCYEGLLRSSESHCQITSFGSFLITSSLNSSCLGTAKKNTHKLLGGKGFAFFYRLEYLKYHKNNLIGLDYHTELMAGLG